MKHLARPLALSLSIVVAGCADSEPARAGGEDPSGEATPTPQMAPADPGEEPQLELSVDGRGEPMNAQARIDVVEGMSEVALTITGSDGADNLVLIDLAFDDVESVAGEHAVQLGPPESEGPYAVAMFEGQVYESRSGEVELSVSSDGSISGNFEVSLVQASPGAAAAAGLEPETAMTGVFGGSWLLSCVSPIRGFTGGHSVSDSAYCNSLTL